MKNVINLQGETEQVALNTPVKTVNGVHYLLTAEETTELAVRATAWTADSVKRTALKEIVRLEAQITPRRQREAILGTDNGWLADQDALIVIERAKLT